MHMSLLFLVIAAVFLLLFVGGIVALVSLLCSEKGRTILKVLLIVPVMLLLVGMLTVFSFRVTYEPRPERIHDRHAHRVERHLPAVNGRVRYNGDPVADGTIRFVSTSPETEGDALAAHIVDGKYGGLQMPAGTYRVEVEAVRTDSGLDGSEMEELDQDLVYNVGSALRADVVAQNNNWLNFDLTADPGEEPIGVGMTDAIALAEPDSAPKTDEAAPAEEKSTPTGDRPPWAGWEEYALHKVGAACRMLVRVGPYSTRLECDQELPNKLQAAVGEYAAVYLEPKAQDQLQLPVDYVRSNIVQDDWEEVKDVVISTTGQIPEKSVPMVQLAVLLEFDRADNARIREEWDKAVVADRLFGVGALTAIVLVLLAGVYGYMELDLVTGGAYRRRLRLAAAGVVLLLIATGFCLYLFASQSAGVTAI